MISPRILPQRLCIALQTIGPNNIVPQTIVPRILSPRLLPLKLLPSKLLSPDTIGCQIIAHRLLPPRYYCSKTIYCPQLLPLRSLLPLPENIAHRDVLNATDIFLCLFFRIRSQQTITCYECGFTSSYNQISWKIKTVINNKYHKNFAREYWYGHST